MTKVEFLRIKKFQTTKISQKKYRHKFQKKYFVSSFYSVNLCKRVIFVKLFETRKIAEIPWKIEDAKYCVSGLQTNFLSDFQVLYVLDFL